MAMKERVFVYEIAAILRVFRINIACDISKFNKTSRAATASDIWGGLKYHKSVFIPNTLKKQCWFSHLELRFSNLELRFSSLEHQ